MVKPMLPDPGEDQYLVAMRRGEVEMCFYFKPEHADFLPAYIANLKRFVDDRLAENV